MRSKKMCKLIGQELFGAIIQNRVFFVASVVAQIQSGNSYSFQVF